MQTVMYYRVQTIYKSNTSALKNTEYQPVAKPAGEISHIKFYRE